MLTQANPFYSRIKRLENLSGELLNLLLPRRCDLCRCVLNLGEISGLCENCKNSISPDDGHACFVCGEPIDGSLSAAGIIRCGECRIKIPPFDMTVFAFRYEGVSRNLIRRFKFGGRTGLSRTIIAPMLCAKLQRLVKMDEVDMVIPVPLHHRRLLKRGFNQSYLLAREIGTAFSIGVSANIIYRKTPTVAQFSKTRAQRKANVRNIFKLRNTAMLKGKRVLLVDDIMTTGATMFEISRILKKGGAKLVVCAIAARAGKN